jgi:hypothetical protein
MLKDAVSMENPLNRSLDEMRKGSKGSEHEPLELEQDLVAEAELEALGQGLTEVYRASGEPPTRSALDWAVEQFQPQKDVDIASAMAAISAHIERDLVKETGARSLGEMLSRARSLSGVSVADAASLTSMAEPAYRNLEMDRMPAWLAPAEGLATLCRRLGIDSDPVLRWCVVRLAAPSHSAHGRPASRQLDDAAKSEEGRRRAREDMRSKYVAWSKPFSDAF